jgi:hypothetical protein
MVFTKTSSMVCKELPRKDGSLFSPSDEIRESGELRIGVTLGAD